jgi:hypothetical protein
LVSDTVSHHDDTLKNPAGAEDAAKAVNQLRLNSLQKVIVFNETLDVNDEMRRIIEIDLFSKCHQMIVTGGSTYGYVAAFKSNRLPYVVNGDTGMKKCIKTDISHPGFRSQYGRVLYRTY